MVRISYFYSNLNPKNYSSVKVELSSVGDFTDFTVHSMQENSCYTAGDQGGACVSAQVFNASQIILNSKMNLRKPTFVIFSQLFQN